MTPMHLIIYDDRPGEGLGQWFLRLSWVVGAWLMRMRGKADHVAGFTSWSAALAWLATVESERRIASIQFWGHGSPGRIYLNRVAFGSTSLGYYSSPLAMIAARLEPGATFWMRSCSVFQGIVGRAFAVGLAGALRCRVASHTRVVGLLQGGLHTLAPGAEPSWPATEGEPPGLWPAWLQTDGRTVGCWTARVPDGW